MSCFEGSRLGLCRSLHAWIYIHTYMHTCIWVGVYMYTYTHTQHPHQDTCPALRGVGLDSAAPAALVFDDVSSSFCREILARDGVDWNHGRFEWVWTCIYCHSHNIWGPRNSFRRFLVPVYYWETVEKPETDPQLLWEWQYCEFTSIEHEYISRIYEHSYVCVCMHIWVRILTCLQPPMQHIPAFGMFVFISRIDEHLYACVCMHIYEYVY
jgi:hypothetical protein